MASRHVDIDPDGDTLIIIPRIKAEGDGKDGASQVTFKTSMKHLTLASPRAKKKFDPMFDPEAFEIVLHIVHAQAHKLPKQLSLATATQVAVIADDLQCCDLIAFFVRKWSVYSDFWAASSTYRELIKKIFICSVFRVKERFPKLTYTAVACSLTQVPNLGLPIDPSILRAIEEKRASVMKEFLKHLYTVERELHDEALCWECRAQNIGYLKYNLHLHQLPTSETSDQWAKITCLALRTKLTKFKYATRAGCAYQAGTTHPSFKTPIVAALKIFSSVDEALDLSPFPNPAAAAE
ncbi:uncharacterized protein Triagg1_5683 [Trichoderma aggressivum f. europaeum]|uniref:BTB domain-containing protein n=1 Tax=Trichoderma aggressivum f. europaeum TaxID=173218 RepID=A0AAE1IGC1_9HYPO|nr:hypothetical protein Triagg1_5683 [Trichoderma aggressivum f. europaeum]